MAERRCGSVPSHIMPSTTLPPDDPSVRIPLPARYRLDAFDAEHSEGIGHIGTLGGGNAGASSSSVAAMLRSLCVAHGYQLALLGVCVRSGVPLRQRGSW